MAVSLFFLSLVYTTERNQLYTQDAHNLSHL
jgi:hypothetical protein